MTATKHGSKWLLALVLALSVGCDGASVSSGNAVAGAEAIEVVELVPSGGEVVGVPVGGMLELVEGESIHI